MGGAYYAYEIFWALIGCWPDWKYMENCGSLYVNWVAKLLGCKITILSREIGVLTVICRYEYGN